MYGDDSFAARFIRATPGTPQLSRALTAGMRYAAAVASSDAFRSDLVRSSLYRFLAGLTIAAYGPAEEAAFRLHTAEARRRTFNAAARFIDDNAGRPITVDDVARAVGVATAELRDLFLGYHPRGMTPAGHLRSVRLAAAHEDLQRAAPGRGAAAVIARRWGYADLRAFATDYVRAYGVTPAWALKR
jgi:AraC-like DNA-binding protein